MLKRTSLVFRLFIMLAMALGLATLMASPAAAQTTQTGQCQITTSEGTDQRPCTIVIDSNGQCQLIDDAGGTIFQNAQGCGLQSCPRQITSSQGSAQFHCDDIPPTNVPPTNVPPTNVPPTNVPPTNVPPTNVPPTNVPPTNVPPTNVPATATNVPATATHVPATATVAPGTATHVPATATHVPATATHDGGQANPTEKDDKPMEVSVLPDTGQGPDGNQSNTANMLLLGAMGMVLTLGAVAMRLRKNG